MNYIYLLPFKDHKYFKIGLGSSTLNRAKMHDSTYGVDWSASIYFHGGTHQTMRGLEQVLLGSSTRIDDSRFEGEDGYTEIRCSDEFETVLSLAFKMSKVLNLEYSTDFQLSETGIRPEDRLQEAIRLWETDKKLRRQDIAKKLGVSSQTILNYLPVDQYGIRKKKRVEKNRVSNKAEKTKDSILKWRLNNPSGKQTECAKELGKGIATIQRYWNK